ncbi:MAG: GpE family phage tail protein [Comamonas sp.]
MADIAFVFHWPLSSMDAMELSELVGWQQLAVKRFNAVNSPPDRKA